MGFCCACAFRRPATSSRSRRRPCCGRCSWQSRWHWRRWDAATVLAAQWTLLPIGEAEAALRQAWLLMQALWLSALLLPGVVSLLNYAPPSAVLRPFALRPLQILASEILAGLVDIPALFWPCCSPCHSSRACLPVGNGRRQALLWSRLDCFAYSNRPAGAPPDLFWKLGGASAAAMGGYSRLDRVPAAWPVRGDAARVRVPDQRDSIRSSAYAIGCAVCVPNPVCPASALHYGRSRRNLYAQRGCGRTGRGVEPANCLSRFNRKRRIAGITWGKCFYDGKRRQNPCANNEVSKYRPDRNPVPEYAHNGCTL